MLRSFLCVLRRKRLEAVRAWEEILVDHPTDMMAVRQAFLGMINLGLPQENKDILTRILPYYNINTHGYRSVAAVTQDYVIT